MKRETITIPDDLADAVKAYAREQEDRPSFTDVVRSALRQFLTHQGYVRAGGPLHITPAQRGSGLSDVSRQHDRYFAERG